jgi:hypothetical protein
MHAASSFPGDRRCPACRAAARSRTGPRAGKHWGDVGLVIGWNLALILLDRFLHGPPLVSARLGEAVQVQPLAPAASGVQRFLQSLDRPSGR